MSKTRYRGDGISSLVVSVLGQEIIVVGVYYSALLDRQFVRLVVRLQHDRVLHDVVVVNSNVMINNCIRCTEIAGEAQRMTFYESKKLIMNLEVKQNVLRNYFYF